jgi:putative transposase
MVAIIREADRDQVSVVSKRQVISEQTVYTWRKRFGGFGANDVRRLKQLEADNAQLKKLVAERRDGYRMSPGWAHRLWRTAGLQVPRKRPRKRVAATRPPPCDGLLPGRCRQP